MATNRRKTSYRLFIPVVLLASCLGACREKVVSPALQAEIYYAQLLDGQYEAFVRGTYGCESLPEDYLNQRVDLLAQHVKVEQRQRGGYVRVKAVGDKLLSDSTHLVYLDVLFGDSTHEQIACPLLLHNGRWLMRN